MLSYKRFKKEGFERSDKPLGVACKDLSPQSTNDGPPRISPPQRSTIAAYLEEQGVTYPACKIVGLMIQIAY